MRTVGILFVILFNFFLFTLAYHPNPNVVVSVRSLNKTIANKSYFSVVVKYNVNAQPWDTYMLTNVRYFINEAGDNVLPGLGYNGNLFNIMPTFAMATAEFNTRAGVNPNGKKVSVFVHYSLNGDSYSDWGIYTLDLSSTMQNMAREEVPSNVESRSVNSRAVSRDDAYVRLSSATFTGTDAGTNWNTLPIQTNLTKIWNVYWACSDMSNNVQIGYPAGVMPRTSINAGTTYNAGISFLGNVGVYNINCTVTYRLGSVTQNPVYSTSYNEYYLNIESAKRSSNVEVATVNTPANFNQYYFIGLAGAGVAVAAVAIVAAVVIVRRKQSTHETAL